MVANVKIINLDESDIIMRMIGDNLSKENVKEQIGNYLNFKAVLERKINRISAVRGGFELNHAKENLSVEDIHKNYSDPKNIFLLSA